MLIPQYSGRWSLRRRAILGVAASAVWVVGVVTALPASAASTLSISLTAPSADTTVYGNAVTLTLHVDAPASVSSWAVAISTSGNKRLGSVASTGCADITACDVSTQISTIGMPNGTDPLNLTGYADGSQTDFAGGTITVANPTPVASDLHFVSPVVGGTVYGPVTVTADASEAANPLGATITGIVFTAAGRSMTVEDDIAPYTATFDVSPPTPSTIDFTAQAIDSAGDYGPIVRSEQLVERPMTAKIEGLHTPAGLLVPADVAVDVTAMPGSQTSPNYPKSASVSIDGTQRNSITFGPVCNPACTMPTERIAQTQLGAVDAGWHQLDVHGVDQAGGSVDLHRRVFVDPGPNLTLHGPTPHQRVLAGSTVNFTVTAQAPSPARLSDIVLNGAATYVGGWNCSARPCPRTATARGVWHVAQHAHGTHLISVGADDLSTDDQASRLDSPVYVVQPTTLTLNSQRDNPRDPHRVTLTAHLRRTYGSGVPGQTVLLQQRDRTGQWTTVHTLTTGLRGIATTHRFIAATTRFRVVFHATKPLAASKSVSRIVSAN